MVRPAMHRFLSSICVLLFFLLQIIAPPILESGGRKMPDEWIDKDTSYKMVRLSRLDGNNDSYSFRNNSFVRNKRMFYNTDKENGPVYAVDLEPYSLDKITRHSSPMREEVVGLKQDVFIIRLSTYS